MKFFFTNSGFANFRVSTLKKVPQQICRKKIYKFVNLSTILSTKTKLYTFVKNFGKLIKLLYKKIFLSSKFAKFKNSADLLTNMSTSWQNYISSFTSFGKMITLSIYHSRKIAIHIRNSCFCPQNFLLMKPVNFPLSHQAIVRFGQKLYQFLEKEEIFIYIPTNLSIIDSLWE